MWHEREPTLCGGKLVCEPCGLTVRVVIISSRRDGRVLILMQSASTPVIQRR